MGLNSWWSLPWCVGGDFNAIRFPSKRLGLQTSLRVCPNFLISSPLMVNGYPLGGWLLYLVQFIVQVQDTVVSFVKSVRNIILIFIKNGW